MKKNDIAVLLLIVSLSLGVAYFIGKAIMGSFTQESVRVETVEPITADVKQPDPTVFNKDAINPAVPIRIGESANDQPFGE